MDLSASRARSVDADDPTEARPVSQRGEVWRQDPAWLTVPRVSGNAQGLLYQTRGRPAGESRTLDGWPGG